MSFRLPLAAAVIAAAVIAIPSRGDDKKVSYTGTYTWTQKRGDNEVKNTLKIKHDGDKVTGKIENPRGETEISDGAVKDGVLSFTVTREFNGNSFTIKYSGKIEGDALKMKVTMPGRDGGEPTTRDVEAKRESDKA